MNLKTMLNAYPDSIGKNLGDMALFLSRDELKDAFQTFYILPTVFESDLDKGYSIVTYNLNKEVACKKNLEDLKKINIDLSFDFILNHLSVKSPQFQDILKNGNDSIYKDFFINWNKFWDGKGTMSKEGFIIPDPGQFDANNSRKKGFPILMVRFPDGKKIPYWNTFYQKITYPIINKEIIDKLTDNKCINSDELAKYINNKIEENVKLEEIDFSAFNIDKTPIINYLEENCDYLGQLDLNADSEDVWDFYRTVINQLIDYGAKIIRLDAFSRLHKKPGRKNYVNEPESWEILNKIKNITSKHNVDILPEIHAPYSDKYYKLLFDHAKITYDYFFPGLIIDALDTKDFTHLYSWFNEIINDKINVINMLGSHDGIPMQDLKGILPENRIEKMIGTLTNRGGHKKIIHGIKDEVYQMDMTYYSALGCDDKKLELARAIQMFSPGKPQVYYIDLLAQKSDEEVFINNPKIDTREVNRKSYSLDESLSFLNKPIVKKQLELLKLRNTHPVFTEDAKVDVDLKDNTFIISWTNDKSSLKLIVDINNYSYSIE